MLGSVLTRYDMKKALKGSSYAYSYAYNYNYAYENRRLMLLNKEALL